MINNDIEEFLALTPMQEGMLFHYLKEPQSEVYCEQLCMELSGPIDRGCFERAWKEVVRANEMLRAIFRWDKINQPVQAILKEYHLVPQFHDLSSLRGSSDLQRALERIELEDRRRAFDLREVPFRVVLCKIRENRFRLILSNHHILYDGWSTAVILEEFFRAYHLLIAGNPLPDMAGKPRFKEFAKWHRDQDRGKQEQFWRQYLAGLESGTHLPVKWNQPCRDRDGPPIRKISVVLEEDVREVLEGVIKKQRVTPAALFFCAWGILLQKYCDSSDVVFGTTVSGRSVPIKGIEKIVGLFINTVPLRLKSDPPGDANNETALEVLEQVNSMLIARETVENTPLVDIIRYGGFERGEELFDTIVALENYPLDNRLKSGQGALSIRSYDIRESTNYDFSVSISMGRTIHIDIIYHSHTCAGETVQRLGQHFKRILESIIREPGLGLHEIDMLGEEEKQMLLHEFNEAGTGYTGDKTIDRLFDEQVQRLPGHIAVTGTGNTPVHISYGELNHRSNRLAALLREKGAGPDSIVAIMVERSIEMVIGLLGILKAGGAYLPIAADLPEDRIAFMLADSSTHILLTHVTDPTPLNFQGETIPLGAVMNRSNRSNRSYKTNSSHCPADLVYIIYTSGSTGRPKGVLVRHGGLMNMVWGHAAIFREHSGSRMSQVAGISFDAMAFEVWPCLAAGAVLCIADPHTRLDPDLTIRWLIRHAITISFQPTQMALQLLAGQWPDNIPLEVLRAAGDRFTFYPSRHYPFRVFNLYGPTEDTIWTTWTEVPVNPDENRYPPAPSIGKPVPGKQVHILNSRLSILPVGVPGELCIAGSGLARGYLNRPELTNQQFIDGRLYRSGDLARWLPDGQIEFLGRIDQQVKIRGFRIEPGEIEARLLEHDAVKEAVVIAGEPEQGEKYLCAYLVLESPGIIPSLKEYLAARLPDYMVPRYFVPLKKIPLTPNGKVAVRELPQPSVTGDRQHVPPRNHIEKTLAAIWARVLKLEEEAIGIDGDFFELGGHSLNVTRTAALIHKELDVEISFKEIFEHPTIRRLAGVAAKKNETGYADLEPVEEKEYYPLSSAQKRLFVLQLMDAGSTGYNIHGILQLEGVLDRERFRDTFMRLIDRHESFRTSFHDIAGEPVQKIHRDVHFDFEYKDLTETRHKHHLSAIFSGDFIRPFDLSRPPLLRVGLVEIRDNCHLLMVDMHHIISDGGSMAALVNEFMTLYEGKELPRLKIRYRDYAAWRAHRHMKETLKKQETFYLEQFGGPGDIPVLNLPADFARPEFRSFAGCTLGFPLEDSAAHALKRLALDIGGTLYIVLLTAYNIFLHKLSGQQDIVVGTPVAGRSHVDLEPVIGVFVNTLALRNEPAAEKTLGEFLNHLKEKTLDAFANQDYPYEELVERAGVTRDTGRNPLFDTMFILQDPDTPVLEVPGLTLAPYPYERTTAKFDLTLEVVEKDRGIYCLFEYSTALFKEETIRRFSGYFKNIVSWMAEVDHLSQQILDIEIISHEEKQRVLYEFNDTSTAYPAHKTIHRLFREQAARTPGSIAVTGPCIQVAYDRLNRESDQLALDLQERGVRPGHIVAINMERSLVMVITILGILKAGAAYLPIAPGYPEERIDYMLADSGATLCLTGEDRSNKSNRSYKTNKSYETGENSPLAYVIYTSGSTGKPKGVLVEHRAVINTLWMMDAAYPLGEAGAYLLKTAYTFDVSATELFGWFFNGGRLVLLEQGGEKDPAAILDTISSYGVTHINFVPSMFTAFVETLNTGNALKLSSLEYIFLAGEALLSNVVNTFRALHTHVRLENIYGPTEAAIYASRFSLSARDTTGPIPIGKSLGNVTLYVLDSAGHPRPLGAAGELYIGGAGLARGYLNRPELTNRRFVTASHLPVSDLYRTGDLACWRSDGNLQFLGRIDYQVKIRGFRIEPGEIETRLLEYNKIKEAVVVDGRKKSGETYLCAYFTAPQELETGRLREFLEQRLPGYMVPAYFVQMVQMPLNPSGKLDRKRLPPPEVKTAGAYLAPTGAKEKIIAAIWMEVLETGSVGIDDNFFELGGNSLNAIKLSHRLKEEFSKDIPVITVFRYPTVRSMAAYLDREEDDFSDKKQKMYEAMDKSLPESDMAVIGMGGRFPGARTIAEFWDNLQQGHSSVTFFSDEELQEVGEDPELTQDPNYVKAKAVLEDIQCFDSQFFGYTPGEAEFMDPQMRILHETVWAALEDAGYDPGVFSGRIGLYAGAGTSLSWEVLSHFSSRADSVDALTLNNLTSKDYICTRISYKLDLKGPAVEVNTACSTSLVAIHMALRGLRDRECEIALAGGVRVSIPGKSGYLYREGMIYSPDGHCRAFDAGAGGSVAGEGAGIVVLKPLEKAVADGDFIYAVVKGSAINNDGIRKAGYQAPSIEGQAEVISAALYYSGIEPESIGYIETHGTGTQLGDPVEIEALKLAFNMDTGENKRQYCAIGSVKTNIGHLDSAAGVAGFIKTVMALHHRLIPPSLHFETPNPAIDFENSPFYVNTRLTPWTGNGHPLRAGVSSFGIGGTNAHVILEEWKTVQETQPDAGQKQLILLSAKSEPALHRLAANLARRLAENPAGTLGPINSLADIAYTLQVGRKRLEYRAALAASDSDELIAQLSAPANLQALLSHRDNPRVVFMFSGQGAQYVNMGLDLYRTLPVFHEQVDRCFEVPGLDASLRKILYPRDDVSPAEPGAVSQEINRTEYAQPLLFVIEYALAKLLMHWGIRPYAMIGHSIGEYVAACLAGVFSLEDALAVVALRGRLMQKMPSGAMLSVQLSESELLSLLETDAPGVSVAAVNSPNLCVVSGSHDRIDAFSRKLQESGTQYRRLHTSHAFHSHMMEPILEEFREFVGRCILHKPRIPYISNVTGNWINVDDAQSSEYWSTHIRQTVRFCAGLEQLFKAGEAVFLEVGPGKTLSTFARQNPAHAEGHAVLDLVRHLNRQVADDRFLLDRVGQMWQEGVRIDWSAFHNGQQRQRVPLPAYPFEPLHFPMDANLLKLARGEMPGKHGPARLVKRKDMADWFYFPYWQESALSFPDPAVQSEPSDWLIFTIDHPLADSLVDILERSGHEVVTAAAGAGFDQSGDKRFTLVPGREEDYEKLFDRLKQLRKVPDRILHLWTIPGGADNGEPLEHILDHGFYSLLATARALNIPGIDEPVSMVVVSDHMQDVLGIEDLVPAKSTLLGAIKTIPAEFPHIRCCSIDIASPIHGSIHSLAERLIGEYSLDLPDREIAYRGNRRWVRSVKPMPIEPRQDSLSLPLKEEGVYLITGGLGGIGLTLARCLVSGYRARLILTGRSLFPPRHQWEEWLANHGGDSGMGLKIRALLEMERQGGGLLVESADSADEARMREVVALGRERFGTINGVIHAAGTADSQGSLIQVRTKQMSQSVFAPKVNGTLILDAIFKDEPLDFVMFCSSLASVIASPGQAAYCGANAFLDAFAHYKTCKEDNYCISVNWDSWREVGMAAAVVKKMAGLTDSDAAAFETPENGRNESQLDHPMFDWRVPGNETETVYVSRFRASHPWPLDEHRVLGQATLPGTAYLEMARAAFEHHTGNERMELRDVYFLTPLRVEDDGEREVHTRLKKQGEGYGFVIESRLTGTGSAKEKWLEHAHGELLPLDETSQEGSRFGLEELQARFGKQELQVNPVKSANIEFGPRWENVEQVSSGENRVLIQLELPEEFSGDIGVYKLHPALLDAAVGFFLPRENPDANDARLPFSYKRLTINRAMNRRLYCYQRYHDIKPGGDKLVTYDITILDEAGVPVVEIEDYAMVAVSGEDAVRMSPGKVTPAPADHWESYKAKEKELIGHGLTPSEGVDVFLRVLGRQVPQVIISTRDLPSLFEAALARDAGESPEQGKPEKFNGPVQARPGLRTAYVAPGNKLEEKIAGIMENFLGIQPVGIHDDFFELGGDSLKAMTILNTIRKKLNVEIPLAEFFNQPTVSVLAAYAGNAGESRFSAVTLAEKREYYPLSSMQRRMYFLQHLDPGSTGYNLPTILMLQGELDIGKLEEVFRQLVVRHESLRTSFDTIEDEPVQAVHEQVDFKLEPVKKDIDVRQGVRDFVRPFDLSLAPLIRVGLIKEAETRHTLMVDMHHIISDGVSVGLLAREFMMLYAGETLAPVELHYKDYSQWLDTPSEAARILEQKTFWLNRFGGSEEIPVLHLPTDYLRPAVRDFSGNTLNFSLDDHDLRALRELASTQGVTLFMVLTAMYFIFLAKITGQESFILGTPTAGRGHADTETIIGLFVNTIALKNEPVGEKPFTRFLEEVRDNTLEAFANQDFQYEELVESLNLNRDSSRNPLFDTMFILENMNIPEMKIPGLKMKAREYLRDTAKFDLTLQCFEVAESVDSPDSGVTLECYMEYSTQLFEEETVRRFTRYYKQIVSDVLANPGKKISVIEPLPEEEKHRLLFDFNDTARPFPNDRTINRLFECQVDDNPGHVALVFKEETLTFRYFDERANQLANYLCRDRGLSTGDRVAVVMERSIELIITLMGILKAGGAYVPLDPNLPGQRLRVIIADASVGIVISQRRFSHKLAPLREDCEELQGIIYMDDPAHGIETCSRERPVGGKADDPAYVMYTSGSSGLPKGVLVEHRTIVNTLTWRKDYYDYRPGDVSLQIPPYFFDSSVTDIFTPLLGGARLVLVTDHERTGLDLLEHLLPAENVTHFIAVPAFYNVLLEEIAWVMTYVKMICCAGEHFPDQLIKKHFEKLPHVRIVNEYGPTENSVNSTAYELNPHSSRALIGRPISNVQVYILDRHFRLSPIGVTGEICLAGSSLARGYLNNPELTNEKFCGAAGGDFLKWGGTPTLLHGKPSSHVQAASQKLVSCAQFLDEVVKDPPARRRHRIYTTGDMGRWLADGNLEFMGRLDTQVKIRGIRVEIAEIENQLMRRDDIKEAVVLAREYPGKDSGAGSDRYLCAYVVLPLGTKVTPDDLKAYLTDRLPEYMVPAYFVMIDAVPFTPSGKINREALPAPELSSEVFIAPESKIEKSLARIWSAVLGIKKETIGIDSDFFKLGGHSLKATVIASRIHKTFDVQVPLTEIFVSSTIRELARYIEHAGKESVSVIRPVEKKQFYPLSAAQGRLYLLHLHMAGESGGATAYNLPTMYKLEGDVDKDRLESTFRSLIQRHESFRTSFHMIAETPVQIIHEDAPFHIRYTRETGDFIRPFDLSRAPLLRVALAVLPEEEKSILMVDMHHIISDGTSAGILVKEFMTLYGGGQLPDLPLRYTDYVQWRHEMGTARRGETFWLEEFAGEIPVLELPGDYVRPAVQDFGGRITRFKVDAGTTRSLNAIAVTEGATLFMVLLAIYNIFLSKVSGQDIIVVGTPTAGRAHADLEPIIGMFVNTLALKNRPAGEKTFGEFLNEVKQKTLNAFANQDYQYEELVENVNVNRDTGHNPLFDTLFTLRNVDIPELHIPGLTIKPYDYESRVSKFDLSMQVIEEGEELQFILEYCVKLFKEDTIYRFTRFFKKTLADIVAAPGRRISTIQLISQDEKQQILYRFNDTTAEYPRDKTLHQLVEEQAERDPDRSAVVFFEHQLTYAELEYRSRRLAGLLMERGIGTGNIAGILVERSLDMFISLLAVLKSGAAYLPIDPSYPGQRIDFILADSGAKVLVTKGNLTRGIKRKPEMIDIHSPEWSNVSSSQPLNHSTVNPFDLAYVIYTSGSTGKPKGVMIEHYSVVNLVVSQVSHFPITASERVLQFSSIAFDASVEQIFIALSTGAALVLVSKEVLLDGERFEDFVCRYAVTHLHAVPSFLKTLDIVGTCQLKRVISGGDICPVSLAVDWSQLCDFYNEYGPTETTVTAIEMQIGSLNDTGSQAQLPIGRPIANTMVYILDRWQQLVPVGVAGELYIGGDGVARGYLNRPELTAGRFIDLNRLYRSDKSSRSCTTYRSYRTGDLARWLPDDNIQFLGRADHQVKVRGYRIELGEIETRLSEHENIADAAVIVRQDSTGEKYLCAYVVPADPEDMDVPEVKNRLSRALPAYMIPSTIVPLEQLPLTPNGKVDRAALPAPRLTAEDRHIAPRDEIETALADIWARILGVKRSAVGIDGHFFKMGGQSLKAAVLASRVFKAFKVRLPMTRIFNTPRIRDLAQYIRDAVPDRYAVIPPAEEKEFYPLSSAQERLYVLHQMDPHGIVYNMPVLLTVEGHVEKERFEQTFRRLVQRHESLRTSFHMVDGRPMQKIHPDAEFSIGLNGPLGPIDSLDSLVRPFDLSQAPLLRVGLMDEGGTAVLMVDMHHIISDGASMDIMVHEFNAFYDGQELPPPALRYKDYVQWRNREVQQQALREQEAFWLNRFAGEIPVLKLPHDFPRQEVQTFEGGLLRFELDADETRGLSRLAMDRETTLFILLNAVVNVFLARLTGQEDIVIGTLVEGRDVPGLENIIGMFVNTLALRHYPSGRKTFTGFLEEVKQETLNAFENSGYPLEELVEKLGGPRDKSHNPLFDILFTVNDVKHRSLEIPGLKLTPHKTEHGIAKFDLTLTAFTGGDTLVVDMEYHSKLFTPDTIRQFSHNFRDVVTAVLENNDTLLEDISLSHNLVAAKNIQLEKSFNF
jgi:amino acid adenylation domain-containing protein